jgi:hypothetical protein
MDETIKKYNYWNLRNNIIHSFPDFRDEAMIYVNDVEYICEGCKKPLCSIVTKENGQILCAECYTELNIAKTIKESKFPTSISQLEL